MRKYLLSLLLSISLFVPTTKAEAQNLASLSISTAGADCSTSTNCASFSVAGVPSIGVYLNVGTSGTFNFEATIDRTNWFSISDDVNAASSATADGAFFFSNPGYAYIRVRASAISGTATIVAFKGFSGLKSTATLSGSAQGDGSLQDGASASIEATVRDYANSNPLAVALTDANGDLLTNFGGGTSATGSAVPSSANYFGLNVGGTLRGATGASLGSTFSQHVAIVDGSGNQITTFGGGTQYAAGTASATPTGTVALAWDGTNVRPVLSDSSGNLQVEFASAQAVTQSGTWNVANTGTFAVQATQSGTWNIGSITTLPSLPAGANIIGAVTQSGTWNVGNTGTFATQAAQSGTWTLQPGNTANTTPWLFSLSQGGNTATVNASGQLAITCANCSGSGASDVDNSTFTVGSDSGAPAMGLYQSSPTTVTSGNTGVLGMTASRALKVSLFDASGTAVTPGTDYTHDAPLTIGSSTGPMIGGRASAAVPTDVSADNDFVAAWFLRSGAQAIQPTFGGVLASAGNGAAGTGVQRVTEANDSQLSTDVATIKTAVQLIDDDQTGSTAGAVNSAASDNSTNLKSAAGRIMGIYLTNTTTTTYYLKIYNTASAPTCTNAPTFQFAIPPGAASGQTGGFALSFGPTGLDLGTGISYCITAGAGTTGTSAATGIYGVVAYK